MMDTEDMNINDESNNESSSQNNKDGIEKDNENEDSNNDSRQNINPLSSPVVQKAQKSAIIASQQSNIPLEEMGVITEEQVPPKSGDIKDSSDKKDNTEDKPKGETTTIDTTTPSTSSDREKIDEMISSTQKMATLVGQLNSIRNNAVELDINYDELVYFQRLIRPLIDSAYFLALSTQGTALAAQALNNINIAKPKQVEAAVDLAYSFIKELSCLLEVLKCRLDTYLNMIEENGCNKF